MSKVVFVLGAGASHHLGFPTGSSLISETIKILSVRSRLADTVNLIYGAGTAQSLAKSLQNYSLDSIDQFMQIHSDDTLRNACRFVITFKILEAEYRSIEIMRERDKLRQNWYHLFRQFLHKRPELAGSHAFSFLSFNYDRSLEYFLKLALDGDSRVSPSMSQALLEVFHLHGSFGALSGTQQAAIVPYGGGNLFSFNAGALGYVKSHPIVLESTEARDIANRIAFPHDKIEYGVHIARILGEAELVVIVGFGFARENCDKILLRSVSNKGIPVMATAMNLTTEAREYLADFPNVELFDMSSDVFFDTVLRKRFAKVFSATALV